MDKNTFLLELQSESTHFNSAVAAPDGQWIVKGFIDIFKNIYTISGDTKIVSKIMELLLFPHLAEFAQRHSLKMVLAAQQNFYPDITFVDSDGHRFALDLKSTYRKTDPTRVNGMTLGAFTGYFRKRTTTKNTTYPYATYEGHYVLGFIYSKAEGEIDELRKYGLDDLENMNSVVKDFQFFVQEKYRIALDRPGSGNTKNIGSVTSVDKLINGTGPFAALGIDTFDDYWMYYLTRDMAQRVDLSEPPYTNLKTYAQYKGLTIESTIIAEAEQEDTDTADQVPGNQNQAG